MSGTRKSSALDEMTAEETALLKEMEAADASLPQPAAEPREPEPAEETTEQPEPEAAPAAEKLVNKKALDEERSRRKKAERSAQEQATAHAAELARAQTRLEMLAAAAEAHVTQERASPAAETPAPAFDTDPKAWIEHNVKALNQKQAALDARLAELAQGTNQTAQQQREAAQISDLQIWGQMQEAEFARDTPDYQAAVAHLATAREAQLRAIGVENPAEIRNTIMQDVTGLAAMARQRGKNFGEMLYTLAQANGYRAGQAAPSATSPRATPQPANAAERLMRGQDMAATLGATGGAPSGAPAITTIANMSDEAFEKMYAAVKAKGGVAMKSLFGS